MVESQREAPGPALEVAGWACVRDGAQARRVGIGESADTRAVQLLVMSSGP